MSANFTPFKQIPVWDDATEFTITGKQLRAIHNLFNAYTPFATAMEPILTDNLDNGKITIRYEDLEGNELSKEKISEMFEAFAQSLIADMGKLTVEE